MKKLAVCWSQFSRKAGDTVRISANLLNLHWKPTVSQVARAWYWGEKKAVIKACSQQKYSAVFLWPLVSHRNAQIYKAGLGHSPVFYTVHPSHWRHEKYFSFHGSLGMVLPVVLLLVSPYCWWGEELKWLVFGLLSQEGPYFWLAHADRRNWRRNVTLHFW